MVLRDLFQNGPNNRGGSYVTSHRSESNAGGGHVLYVAGPVGAVTQVQFTNSSYVKRHWETIHGHALDGAGAQPKAATETLLELLRGAVTVPCPEHVDFAIALDWLKKIVDGKLGERTDLAELVHVGKRLIRVPTDRDELRRVGTAVVGELLEFIVRHPLLSDVDAIASVPGHDSRVLSFGSSVAFAVARERGIELIRCGSAQDYRAPLKQMALEERAAAIRGQFNCPADVTGRRVLIVDDVYSTGATVQETARVLRVAGASHVASLAAVRTMRSL